MKTPVFICIMIVVITAISCSKRNHPARTAEINEMAVKRTDSLSVKKVSKPKKKEPAPKVIAVNDSVAKKSIDGRLYYDLMGQRYWKNYRDGKYYLFNKSMYTNDAFKKPG